jgi:glycosyltransferase involved in cell wall biosynthesis
MLKVIHVGPSPLTVGGTQSVIRTIADFGIGADRISVKPTWTGSGLLVDSQLVRRAAGTILRADSNTIVHVHLSSGGAYLRDGPLIVLAQAQGLRVVVSIHGSDLPEFCDAHPRLVGTILSRAHGILCLSDDTKDAVRGLGVGGRVTKLANPVAIDEESPPVRSTEPIALFAGRIERLKGVDVLVDAWRTLLERGIEGRCRLVGPLGDYRPPQLDRMSIEEAVDQRDVKHIIRSSRLVILPSRTEGMPMILTEALAAGRPFVATSVGGTADLAPCREMLVPVGDADALADAIERFMVDTEAAQRVGERCKQFCRETRSPAVIDSELRDIYRDLRR